jgi:hypothetical protein
VPAFATVNTPLWASSLEGRGSNETIERQFGDDGSIERGEQPCRRKSGKRELAHPWEDQRELCFAV